MTPEMQVFLKILSTNPGSIVILVTSAFLAVLYFVQVTWRISAMERKLGLKPSLNGTEDEVVVTKGDLLRFETNLIKQFAGAFTDADICVLKHDDMERRVSVVEHHVANHPSKAG